MTTDENGPFDAGLRCALDTTIDSVDTTASPPDEIAEGLQLLGVHTWDDFINLDEAHLSTLQKKANHKLVDISTVAKDKIINLHDLILDSESNGVSDWDDPAWCTWDLHRQHVRVMQRGQQQNVKQHLKCPSGGGSSFGHAHTGPGKSPALVTEKECNAWQRCRASKDSFPILKDDLNHSVWKRDFEAKLKAQKSDRVVAIDFDPHALQESCNIKSCKQQNAHLWTVLLQVLIDDMGRLCVSDHSETRDARQAFLDHQQQQETSECREHSAGALLTDLTTFHLSNHRGTGMSFITEWFAKHQVLNEVAGCTCGCKFVRSVPQPALQSDN